MTADTPRGGWRDIESAPRDGTRVLLQLKDPIPSNLPWVRIWDGIPFVGQHPGLYPPDDFDIGWQFAAPVGQGGFPDEWLDGWQPLPAPPETENG